MVGKDINQVAVRVKYFIEFPYNLDKSYDLLSVKPYLCSVLVVSYNINRIGQSLERVYLYPESELRPIRSRVRNESAESSSRGVRLSEQRTIDIVVVKTKLLIEVALYYFKGFDFFFSRLESLLIGTSLPDVSGSFRSNFFVFSYICEELGLSAL